MSSNADISCVVVAGDLRRGNELVSDLVLVAERPSVKKPAMRVYGDLTVHFSDATHFGAQLLAATGSKKHLDELRHLAAQKGFTLKPNGLFKAKKLIASRTEQEIYQALGLGYIEPELREGLGEIDLAILDQLPKLIRDTDIQGVLHVHTDASDGVNTLEEMAKSTRERGYSYLGLTDHSKSAHYAGGLSIAEVRDQQKEIDRLNADYAGNFRIFKGIESDILPDGSLDYPDEVLELFDFVIASVHGQFRKDRAAQTERILRAVANPRTTILGHMTGRQLLRRAGYEVDVERVLAACAQHGVGVEINANPWRLDLDWRWHRRALELGCSFSIDPDAHSTDEIDLTHWGVEMARKGSITPERVLNCLNLKNFQAHLLARKAHR